MKLMTIAAGLVALTAFTPSFAQEAAMSPAPAAAVVETPVAAEAAAPTGSEGKARILFFRPWRLPGGVYTYHVVEVGDDGKPAKGAERLVSLPNGGAGYYEAEPGIHSFNITGPMAVNKAEDRIRMEVEPGETYYVEQTVRIGAITGGFRLVPATEARFIESKAKLGKGDKDAKTDGAAATE